MIRAVVDTKILIRAVIRPFGTVGPIARQLRQGAYTIILSEPLIDEWMEKLHAPRIAKRYKISGQDILDFAAELAESGELIYPIHGITACRDADDNHVLEAAVEGNADYIVTGDENLLVLDPFEGIRIVTPREFLERLT